MIGILLTRCVTLTQPINLNKYYNNLNSLYLIISGKILSLTVFWTNIGPDDIFIWLYMLP